MIVFPPSNASARRGTWRRHSARTRMRAPTAIPQYDRSDEFVEMMMRLSRGRIDHKQAQGLLSIVQANCAVEVQIDLETGEVQRVSIVSGHRSTDAA